MHLGNTSDLTEHELKYYIVKSLKGSSSIPTDFMPSVPEYTGRDAKGAMDLMAQEHALKLVGQFYFQCTDKKVKAYMDTLLVKYSALCEEYYTKATEVIGDSGSVE